MKRIIIAVDGPAGAGKSTISRLAAQKLGYAYIDTGAMYRSVTWKFLKTHRDFSEAAVIEAALSIVIEFKQEDGVNRVFADGTEVTDLIRSNEVTLNVSKVSAISAVREAMVSQQRHMGKTGGVVLDGRDIGTVVFPQAELKVFLTASVEERAKRRYLELLTKGQVLTLEQITSDIAFRDKQDMERSVSPLRQAEDAVLIDSSYLSIDEVVSKIVTLAQEKI